MPRKSLSVGAIIGSALMALSLAGSHKGPANLSKLPENHSFAESVRLHAVGKVAFSQGRYEDAREAFHAAATAALTGGSAREAAMDWSNAGFASVTAMQYGPALEDLTRARNTAQTSGEMVPLIYALNNLASLYLQMGAPNDALRIASEALSGPAGHADPGMRAKLLYQEAQALKELGRFDAAESIFGQALDQMTDAGDLDAVARGWANLGGDYLDASRYADAERALSESLRLVRTHHLRASANVLTNLAKLRGRQGDRATAEHLFQEALDARESLTPAWVIYYERGLFRLEAGNNRAALGDFRESRRLAIRMRADIVPADQNRISLENRVNRIFEGLVAAGNRVAVVTGDSAIPAETFDASEQDRRWSLRALVPGADDWRSRLPSRYWELLARFQSAECSLLEQPSPAVEKQTADLEAELEQAEAAAQDGTGGGGNRWRDNLPSKHVRNVLDADSVLFSFSLTDTGSWLWVADRGQLRVYSLPARAQIQAEVTEFTRALQAGKDATPAGLRLYRSLFSKVPATMLSRRRWLLEPDGPLYDLPFAALPAGGSNGATSGSRRTRPSFLIERVALQLVPGALLMEKGGVPANGSFVGVGDPVFNGADPRSPKAVLSTALYSGLALPRLPNTAGEVEACARAWGSDSPELLTGSAANIGKVESALAGSPAVIHFATHVVTAPGEFGSGLIALGLDDRGAMGLMGPKDIAARRVDGALVVMNGCHSGQGGTLPGSGEMGLTRAWIAAGALAVVATRWDVPDETAQSLMVAFYRALRRSPHGNPAIALRAAQLAALSSGGADGEPARWAGYFLLSRI